MFAIDVLSDAAMSCIRSGCRPQDCSVASLYATFMWYASTSATAWLVAGSSGIGSAPVVFTSSNVPNVTCLCADGTYYGPTIGVHTCSSCPAGRYGAASSVALFNSSCSGDCSAGYYCPSGSNAPTLYPCGSAAFYCPAGASAPIPVSVGYYTTGGVSTNRTGQQQCPVGSYCSGGIATLCQAGR